MVKLAINSPQKLDFSRWHIQVLSQRDHWRSLSTIPQAITQGYSKLQETQKFWSCVPTFTVFTITNHAEVNSARILQTRIKSETLILCRVICGIYNHQSCCSQQCRGTQHLKNIRNSYFLLRCLAYSQWGNDLTKKKIIKNF